MGPHVVRFRCRRVVDVAADVQVVFFRLHLCRGCQARISFDLTTVLEYVGNLFDVFGPQAVLVLSFGVFRIGVNEKHLVFHVVRFLLVDYENAGRYAGSVKKPAWQSDNGFQYVGTYEMFAVRLFWSGAEQYSVRKYAGKFSILFETRDHMLEEHKVGFAFFGHFDREAFFEFQISVFVILRKWRVRQDFIEVLYLSIRRVVRSFQSIFVLYVVVRYPVEYHIHLTDRPRAAVVFLPIERNVGRILVLFDVLFGLQKETATAHRWIVDRFASFRFHDLDQKTHDLCGRVKLSSFFSCAVGELLDQVFVGCTKKVRKFKVFITKAFGIEMHEEFTKFLVSNLRFSFGRVEIDMPKDPVQTRVRFFNGSECFIESASDVDLHVFQITPSRFFWNEKVEVTRLVFSKGDGFFF